MGAGDKREDLAADAKGVVLYGLIQGTSNLKRILVDSDGKILQGASTLPTGAATEAKQDDGITQLTTIAGDTTSLDGKVTACDTTGKSTEAKQDDTITLLTSLDGKIVAVDTSALATAAKKWREGHK